MNPFNAKAAEAGRVFIQDFPTATSMQIDEAAPKLNPARRHFQLAAKALQYQIKGLGKVFYRWEVKTAEARVVGFSATSDEAQAEVKLWMKLVKQDGEKVTSFTIENQNGDIVTGVSFRTP